jgi:NAD(P)-dependent dehydrogenase (short-subunit alcohol dehydrogenase family)
MRKVLITAGASGIGACVARAFLDAGDRVAVCDIADIDIPGVVALRCDMGVRAEIERMVPEAVAALGGLDVLVNNAGIAGPTAPVQDVDPAAWDRVVAVNITAMFDTTRLAIPYLKRSDFGTIVNMSSAAGRFGYPNRSPYAATKWAVVGFTKTLAIELGRDGITANAILPGSVDGERIRRVMAGRAEAAGISLDEAIEQGFATQSLKKFIPPENVAALILFLASQHGRMISGQALAIDGDMQRAGQG